MISRFKSDNFKIGSNESIFLTSLNAFSCSAPHSTFFGALFLVNCVNEAITSAQISTIKIYHARQFPTRFLCFGPFSIQYSPHRFILRFCAISLQRVTQKFDLVKSDFALTGSKTQICLFHSFKKSHKISICFDQFSVLPNTSST